MVRASTSSTGAEMSTINPLAASQQDILSLHERHEIRRDSEQAPFSRSLAGALDTVIQCSSQRSLLADLANAGGFQALTPKQKSGIKNILDKYDPRTLANSPIINVRGQPVAVNLTTPPLTDFVTGERIPITGMEKGILRMMTNYPEHKKWESQNLEIRTMRRGEAETVLAGQQGVFAKRHIPAGTAVTMFGGMLIANSKDAEFDEQIRKKVGLDPHKYVDPKAVPGGVLQGMGIGMKLNSSGDDESNLFPAHLNVMDPSGKKIKITAFIASKPIPAGSEMRYNYGSFDKAA